MSISGTPESRRECAAATVNPVATELHAEFPLLWKQAQAFDFAERLGGCSDPLLAEIDRAMRELYAARHERAVAGCGDGVHRFHETAVCECAMQGSAPERAEGHERMLTVYDSLGQYAGCIGSETWERLLAQEADNGS